MVIRSVHTGGGLTLEGSLNFKGGTGTSYIGML